jgi:transposase
MVEKKRRTFSKQFKEDAVRLVKESGESLATVARNIGVGESSLRNWVRQAEIDAGRGPTGVPTTSERAKIQELQRKLRDVERERDFLKKAAAFFAKETESTK